MHHLLQQVYSLVVKVGAEAANVFIRVAAPLGECHFHLWKICKTLPSLLARSAERPENLKDLPNFGVTCEQGPLVRKFKEDGTDRPHIDSC